MHDQSVVYNIHLDSIHHRCAENISSLSVFSSNTLSVNVYPIRKLDTVNLVYVCTFAHTLHVNTILRLHHIYTTTHPRPQYKYNVEYIYKLCMKKMWIIHVVPCFNTLIWE